MQSRVSPWIMYASLLALPLTTSHVLAAPISSDLAITGSVALSTTIGASPFSDGNVTQSGAIRTSVGGTTTSNGFSTTPGTADGVDDGTTTLPASNPLSGNLTNTGDGIGWNTNLDALFETGFNFNPGYDFIVDLGFNLANNSLTDTFTITMQLDYSHAVDVDGIDAYADSKLDLEVDTVNVFINEVLSDSLLGDARNGVATGTSGDLISDSGIFSFDIILAPGAVALIGGTHQWEGGVFDTGFSNADVNMDLFISDVACSGTCNVVPVPGALLLFSSGLTGLALFQRRRRKQRLAV